MLYESAGGARRCRGRGMHTHVREAMWKCQPRSELGVHSSGGGVDVFVCEGLENEEAELPVTLQSVSVLPARACSL